MQQLQMRTTSAPEGCTPSQYASLICDIMIQLEALVEDAEMGVATQQPMAHTTEDELPKTIAELVGDYLDEAHYQGELEQFGFKAITRDQAWALCIAIQTLYPQLPIPLGTIDQLPEDMSSED